MSLYRSTVDKTDFCSQGCVWRLTEFCFGPLSATPASALRSLERWGNEVELDFLVFRWHRLLYAPAGQASCALNSSTHSHRNSQTCFVLFRRYIDPYQILKKLPRFALSRLADFSSRQRTLTGGVSMMSVYLAISLSECFFKKSPKVWICLLVCEGAALQFIWLLTPRSFPLAHPSHSPSGSTNICFGYSF